jgi:cytochrome oxidase Cu insertion factor (SCO1/SenC/PrrC family)
MDPKYEHFKDFSSRGLSIEEKRKVWLEISPHLTPESFDAMMAEQKARQPNAPQVGDMAPDFELERLDPNRKRTGEFVRLSALRGQPVALAFGSYT